MDVGEDHGHKHEHGDSCGCGEDHGHKHEHGDDCGCGEDHGHSHGNGENHHHEKPKAKELSDNGKQFRLTLEGLDCAGCAGKIEERTNKLDKVEEATLNFTTKTLVVNLKNTNEKSQAISEIKAIVKKLEPDVVVKEKAKAKKNSPNRLKLTLEGLDCAGCAGKSKKE